MNSLLSRSAFVSGLCAAVLTATLATPPAAAAATGTATCQAPGVAWRVDYEVRDSIYGPVLTATAFRRRTLPSGAWTSADTAKWWLRRDTLPNEPLRSGDPENSTQPIGSGGPGGFYTQAGALATLRGVPVVTYLSPRFISPDAACTVYTFPYTNGTAGQPKIAALGDSLTGQLNEATYNQTHLQGFIQGNFNTAGLRAEVEGQGGRYWLAPPAAAGDPPRTPFGRADLQLLDEARGLIPHGTTGYVIALGTNDAGQIAWLTDAAQRQQRIEAAKTTLRQYVTELTAAGKCVVLMTMHDTNVSYWGSNPQAFTAAATPLNDEMRTLANASPNDRIKLQDWAGLSRPHHTGSSAPWFGADTFHLNDAGKLVYTSEYTTAARQCT